MLHAVVAGTTPANGPIPPPLGDLRQDPPTNGGKRADDEVGALSVRTAPEQAQAPAARQTVRRYDFILR